MSKLILIIRYFSARILPVYMSVEKPRNPVREVGKKLIAPLTQALAWLEVHPNTVSRVGENLASAGAAVLMNQDLIAEQVSKRFKMNPTKARWGAKIVGGVLWLAGIICDAEDGDLAEKTNKRTLFGKWLDATIDRRVDLWPWPFHRANSLHPMDIAIAEVNQAVDTVPALLKTIKPDVPELALGSRFPRLVTLTSFLLFPRIRRITGSVLAAQAIATGYTRHRDIHNNGTEDMKRKANNLLWRHVVNYAKSKFSLEGLFLGFSTSKAMVREYANAKREEILKDDPTADIPRSAA